MAPQAILSEGDSTDKIIPIKKNAEKRMPWSDFIISASDAEIKKRIKQEIMEILSKYAEELPQYCYLALLEPEDSISEFDLNKIFNALSEENQNRTT